MKNRKDDYIIFFIETNMNPLDKKTQLVQNSHSETCIQYFPIFFIYRVF